ncbi:MAG: hypothetical protein H7061_08715 [Bdellovibrionaceae bacterium]|nr:hypothetical protein [Bdellovibrio sp.]
MLYVIKNLKGLGIITLSVVTILGTTLASALASAQSNQCQSLFENGRGQDHTTITNRLKEMYQEYRADKLLLAVPLTIGDVSFTMGSFQLHKQSWYEPDALYIGVANNLKVGLHHFYMVAENVRLDGEKLLAPLKVKTSRNADPPAFTEGVVFKLKVDPATLKALVEMMKAYDKVPSMTCLHPIYQILSKLGIYIDPDVTKGPNITVSQSRFIMALLNNKVNILSNGQLQPLPVEMFAANKNKLSWFLANMGVIDDSLYNATVPILENLASVKQRLEDTQNHLNLVGDMPLDFRNREVERLIRVLLNHP